MNKKERMYQEIKVHGENLNKIFKTDLEPITLAKKLHSLEIKAHKLSTNYCNGENNVTTENWEELTDKILDKVDKILKFREKNVPVFINGDARGYALKIKDSYVREKNLIIYKDWGGYGILAPEFEGRD